MVLDFGKVTSFPATTAAWNELLPCVSTAITGTCFQPTCCSPVIIPFSNPPPPTGHIIAAGGSPRNCVLSSLIIVELPSHILGLSEEGIYMLLVCHQKLLIEVLCDIILQNDTYPFLILDNSALACASACSKS